MSTRNVAEVVKRKSDGAEYEVLFATRHSALASGWRYVRMGPRGQPRSKRKWIPIDKALNDYESPQSDDAVSSTLRIYIGMTPRVKGI